MVFKSQARVQITMRRLTNHTHNQRTVLVDKNKGEKGDFVHFRCALETSHLMLFLEKSSLSN